MLGRIYGYVAIGIAILAPISILLPVTSPAIAQANVLPAAVEKSIKRDIVRQFQVPSASLKVQSFSQQAWPDGCLGLAKTDEICTQATVNGWRVEATDGSQSYIYRTDNTGKNLRTETLPQAVLPLPVARKLRQFANRELGIANAKLRVTAIAPRTFDGCLGIVTPNRACTKIAIPGWQTVLADERRSWVYHLDRNASRIVQNTAASNAVAPVAISFVSTDAALDPNILFTSSTSGDITGRTTVATLATDGKVTRLITAPNIRSRPILLRTLTPTQLDRFKTLLVRRGFANLNGLSYLTSASVADVPTVTLQGIGSSTSYTSIEKQRVPKSLQSIATAWAEIAK
ncbi:hypothetical protein [Chamaesiphon minutus]|uniref:Uncharacterized protein n=1 Tax=Chamaesiphon minutus (strain ATCC 27169 / PCC 6605) TaxID=1173020 RepID=K9UD07_CHAP6|nr:hypothetical protein [Chamaesiphon minutus]AFY92099.1 hypothetical protein Cha6605_0838 [Chamaesiphon minutus PCC 6605]